VEEVSGVDEFDSLKHLIYEHQHGFQRKFTLAIIEEVLKTGTQQVDDHNVIITFDAKPMHIWYSNSSL